MDRLKFLLLAGVLALVVAAVAAGPASAKGGNSANAHLCQMGGWQSLFTASGGTFASQAECVSYGAGGGTLLTNAWQAACVANGGTFSEIPLGGSEIEYQCQPIAFAVYDSSLRPICQGYPDVLETIFIFPGGSTLGTAVCERSGTP